MLAVGDWSQAGDANPIILLGRSDTRIVEAGSVGRIEDEYRYA
jgi:hypothetical protein